MVQNLFHLIGCDAAKLFSASPIYKLLPIAAVAVAFFAPQVISFILLLVVYLLGYGLITYDEAYHTQNYYAFLPIRRSEYIIGKYAFTFVMTIIGILLCFVSSSLGSLILTDPGRPGFGELSDYYALAFIIAMVYLAIQYPFSIFLGGVKGRIVAMVFYFILFFCAFSTDIMSRILSFMQSSSLFLLMVISLLLYCISCTIVLSLYDKKDLIG